MLLLLACGAGCERAREPSAGEAIAAAATITADEIGVSIGVLAHDSMLGRFTPSPGLEAAAEWVAGAFRSLALADPAGGYVQRYALAGDSTPRAPNVIAVLEGADARLSETYIVFSAHLDHLGTGAPDALGDTIYNGADDDASGIAAVIEIAEAFAALTDRPARSIAFVGVSGEELGLLGSAAFLESGLVPPARMVANINIDMIGRNAPDTLVIIGRQYSTLGPLSDVIAARHPDLGLAVIDDPWPDEQFFFRSDHYNFARMGVPSLFLFSGVHDDYHQPSDHADRIDTVKTARIARFAFLLGLAVANDAEPPQWTPRGRREVLH
ncbi:MAG: M20/M25/M40 family metallo-hydrolase [Gemmatimonadetes bacterium]|nr:M20/M25/M40 family metallo-hydrolase [Gemmatimonadota bacterium]